MKLFEVASNAVVEAGVSQVFGLMGDGNMNLITTLSGLGVSFTSSRHEAGAIGMADGFARVTGDVGVCTVTQGPGLTNAVTALITARKARSPMVLLVGDTAPAQAGWPQDIDQHALLNAAGVPVIDLADRRNALAHVRSAFERALAERRPVAVNCGLDTQVLEWDPWDVDTNYVPRTAERLPADLADVNRAAELITAARRPVVIAGKGALWSGCGSALRLLGERVGALMATTLPGKGLFAGDPFEIGIAGSLGTNLATSLISRADLVLVVGASLNDFTTMKSSLFPPSATVIRVDRVDDSSPNRYPAQLLLEGDAASVVDQLLATLPGDCRTGFRTEETAAQIREHEISADFVDRSEPDAMDPRSLMLALDKVLPSERQIVTDVGHFFGFPATFLPAGEPGHYLPAVEFGAVGSGIGVALGAAAGRPEVTTVLFIGDGGLMMSLADLDTVARSGARLVMVVMNDNAYGSELHMLRNWRMPETASVFVNPDLAEVARAVGVRSTTVTSVDGLTQIGADLAESAGPILLDCHVTQHVVADWLAGAFER
jgi:thiamine pyrophosphate-dependent acetolactate synthase large subunit-like protein